MTLFYRLLRGIIRLLLNGFYQVEPINDSQGSLSAAGPLMVVGNHPNGLIDPALLFAVMPRQVTFLAKAPLFSLPVIGAMIRQLGALPVYRKQDDPTQMDKNATSLDAAALALREGRCITLFPEGKSHSEPQLQELKTGAARIALMACQAGAAVKIVPVGLTYSDKTRLRSHVHIEVGRPILVNQGQDARALTQTLFEALHHVTLNLEAWDELPLLKTAEALYALKVEPESTTAERMKAFARGMRVLRTERPAQFQQLKEELAALRAQLDFFHIAPEALALQYRPGAVLKFIVRNLLAVTLLPLFLLGIVLFFIPYRVPRLVVRVMKTESDVEATIKVALVWILVPFWLFLMTAVAFVLWGARDAFLTFLVTPPLAMFTRYYYERRKTALANARTFFWVMFSRRFKTEVAGNVDRLAQQIRTLVDELTDRVVTKAPPS